MKYLFFKIIENQGCVAGWLHRYNKWEKEEKAIVDMG